MPQNQQFDNGELQSMAMGYDALKCDLDNEIRYVGGSNMCITAKGKIAKRPGTLKLPLGQFPAGLRCDRIVIYETLDSPSKVFLVGSFYNTATQLWEAWYTSDKAGATWTTIGTLRNINQSTAVHQIVVSRGLCFIKGFPGPTGDKLGTVVFNGSTLVVDVWGLLGPSAPAAMTSSAGWTASTFPVSVLIGWQYVYTYKTLHGQESNRSPLQTDPSKAASNTGNFTNKCPAMTLTGNSDTTHVPRIVIYRTTDGGGTFYKVEEINNPGAGTFTYEDRHFNDGTATPAQPYPDTALDVTIISPSLTSNSPPPSVTSTFDNLTTITVGISSSDATITMASLSLLPSVYPYTITIESEQIEVTSLSAGTTVNVTRAVNGSIANPHVINSQVAYTPVVGIDPVQPSTPISNWNGRNWYFVGNILFYSANEELTVGVQDDSWPSGIQGNFYRFQHQGVYTIPTAEALYVYTTNEVWWIRGYSKETFSLLPLFTDIGARPANPFATATADKSVIWLTSDLRICMARGPSRTFLSDQLGQAFFNLASNSVNGVLTSFVRYQNLEKDWLVVLITNTLGTGPADSTVYVYDFNQTPDGSPLWNIPWTVNATSMCAGRLVSGNYALQRVCFTNWDGTSVGGAVYLDTTEATANGGGFINGSFITVTDFVWPSSTNNYGCSLTISNVRNPTGNHINALRLPGMVSTFYALKIDRTTFPSDTDPSFTYVLDSSIAGAGAATPVTGVSPPRRVQSTGYTTLWYETGGVVCERVSVSLDKPASSENFEIQKLAYVWDPDLSA